METSDVVNCTVLHQAVICNGTKYVEEVAPITYHNQTFWIYLLMYIFLVIFAGLMSGLTLGLLSLDLTSLRVIQTAGTDTQKKYAARILPIVKRHHLLLVTLLLMNAIAVETMPIFLDRISDPLTAILVSVTAVLIFGEVFPQALCSRFGLAIGYFLAPLVYVLMAIGFVISYPLSKFLDCILGDDHSTFYRRAELKALVDLHGPAGIDGKDTLTYDEVLIIKGALELRDKTVEDAMVALDSVYMLDIESKLDKETLNKMLRAAHSRIPVYENNRHNIVGIILVKTLVCLDNPQRDLKVRTLVNNKKYGRRVHAVKNTMALYDLLNEFQKGKAHLAVVMKYAPDSGTDISTSLTCSTGTGQVMINQATNAGVVCGIITLEDVLEELLQEEIIDETDVYIDVRNRVKVARAKSYLSRSMSMQTDSSTFTDTASGFYRSVVPPLSGRTNNARQQGSHSDSDITPLLS